MTSSEPGDCVTGELVPCMQRLSHIKPSYQAAEIGIGRILSFRGMHNQLTGMLSQNIILD